MAAVVEDAGLALPVVSAQALANGYPDVPLATRARRAGLEGQEDDLAALVVLSAADGTPATVNLAAPFWWMLHAGRACKPSSKVRSFRRVSCSR